LLSAAKLNNATQKVKVLWVSRIFSGRNQRRAWQSGQRRGHRPTESTTHAQMPGRGSGEEALLGGKSHGYVDSRRRRGEEQRVCVPLMKP